MRILAAEPDWTRLAALTALLRRVCPAGELHTFLSPQALEAWLDRHGPAADAVFLPADGPGLALARALHRRRPRISSAFTSGISKLAVSTTLSLLSLLSNDFRFI